MTDDRFARRLADLMNDLAANDEQYVEDVLARTAHTRQRPAWAFPSRWIPALDMPLLPPAWAGRILVVAALMALLVLLFATVALVGGLPEARLPTSVAPAVAEQFVEPFEYTIPRGSELAATTVSPQMYALTEGSSSTYPGFGYEPVSDVRGITIAFARGASTHGASGRADLRLRADALLNDLQRNPALTVGPISGTSLGGLSAVRSDVAAAPAYGGAGYPDLHLDPLEGDESAILALAFPGTLTVAQVRAGPHRPYLAADAEELERWLPMAEGFVTSIRFLEAP